MPDIAAIKRANSKRRYTFVKREYPEIYNEIAAFSSVFGGSDEIELRIRTQVEDYCMGIVMRVAEAERDKFRQHSCVMKIGGYHES